MTDHPITPPLELVQEWYQEASLSGAPYEYEQQIAARAAQWGYGQRGEVNEAKLQKARDQELKECCEWLKRKGWEYIPDALRAARRPKPPSLKEQAWKLLECYGTSGVKLTADQCNTILRALKALPHD